MARPLKTRRGVAALTALALATGAAGCAVGGGDEASVEATETAGGETARPGTAAAPERKPGPVSPRRPAPRASPSRSSYAPWPLALHDARHSAAAAVNGPTTGRVAWRRKLEGPVVPGPVVGRGGVAYAASNGGVLHALRVSDGRELWRFDGGSPYGSDLSASPAILREGTILWPGPGGLFALDRAGRMLWKVPFTGMLLSPVPASAAGDGRPAPPGRLRNRVYVTEMSGTLHALDLRGREEPSRGWSLALGGTSYGSPALAADGTIYETAGRDLIAIRDRGERASVRWRFRARDIVEVSAAVAPDGTVVLGTNDRFQYGIGPDGRERWRFAREDLTYSSPGVTADGVAYFGDHRGFLNALDARSGRLVARYRGQGRTREERNVGIWSAPAIDARRNVYFGNHPGKLFGYAYDGRKLFEIDTGGVVDSYPALAGDGTLLIGSESGVLYAIRD